MTLDYTLAKLALGNRDGADWYETAGREIAEVCNQANWDRRLFTGILAVTSPRVSVARNVRITLHYMETGLLFDNVMSSIRKGIEKFTASGEISGLKTSAFYRALMGDENSVVLDVHMANLLAVDQKEFAKKRVYNQYADFIRGIACLAGLTPRQCQAALWTAQLRLRGRAPTRMNVARERTNQLVQGGFPASGPIRQLVSVDGSFQPCLF